MTHSCVRQLEPFLSGQERVVLMLRAGVCACIYVYRECWQPCLYMLSLRLHTASLYTALNSQLSSAGGGSVPSW
jgi:hypothetical protein